jgi:hypothetical protein
VTAVAAMVKTSVNIPLTDDYGAITQFLYLYVHTHGFLAHIEWILTAQHNEYKLILLSTVVALQYHIVGHANYRALQLLGDLSVPAVLWLLWLLLARQHRPFRQAIWFMLLPWYLFLSLCYFETVNWANTEIQELTIVPLAIACVFFFTSSTRHATRWGTLFLILSIASFASGFIFAIALLILLIYQRRLGASLTVALATCIMAAIYSFHYTAGSTAGHSLPPLGVALTYSFVFLGGILSTIPSCAVLGVLLIAGFIFLLTRGWARLSPDTFCIALFCILTAVAVAPGRYQGGVSSAMTSRYNLYPLMLLCAEYLAALRIFVPQPLRFRSTWTAALGLATLAAVAFGITSQMRAYRVLHARQRLLLTHMILWERHPERLVVTPDEPGYFYGEAHLRHRIESQEILARSVANGLYIPPVTAQDPLPVKPHSGATLGIEDEAPPSEH